MMPQVMCNLKKSILVTSRNNFIGPVYEPTHNNHKIIILHGKNEGICCNLSIADVTHTVFCTDITEVFMPY